MKRVYRRGVLERDAYLDDYAFLAQGLLALYRATGEARWLRAGRDLVDQMVARFWDEEGRGFFFTQGGEDLIVRLKSAQDSALPAGNAVAVYCLMDLARWTGEVAYLERARQTLWAFGGMMGASPSGFTHMIAAARRYLEEDGLALSGGATAMASNAAAATRREAVATSESLLRARVDPAAARPRPGQPFQIALHLEIREGWHINAHPASSDMLVPTTLNVNADLPLEVLQVAYPPAEHLYFAARETLEVYQDQVILRADLRLKPETMSEARGKLHLWLRYQACDQARCLPPAELFETIPLEVAAVDE